MLRPVITQSVRSRLVTEDRRTPRAEPEQEPEQEPSTQLSLRAPAEVVPYSPAPASVAADECKRCMCLYETVDADIRRLQGELAAKKKALTDLASRIAVFMREHDVEDLQTRDSRLHLRLRTSRTKRPLPKKEVSARILTALGGDEQQKARFMKAVYDDGRETREAVKLTRVRRRPALHL
jgi:hypothetical protein